MIGNRYAIELVRLLESKNIPAQYVLQGTGLGWESLQNDEQKVRKHHMKKIIDNAIQLVPETDLGLQFGLRLNTNTHGILGYALMSCSNLREVFNVWLKYYKIAHEGLQLTMTSDGEKTVLAVDIPAESPEKHIFAVETLFASVYTTGKFLINEHLHGIELWLNYPPPAHAGKYEAVFSLKPHYDKPQCQLHIPEKLLGMRLASANTAAAKMYQQQCAEMLRTLSQRQGVARQVQKMMLERSGDFPRITQIAQQLHMSERTLRRKLNAEGTSFQDVLNDVRYNISCEYLRSMQLSIADIAELLGFADPSNFRRAFIQWAGMSPAAFRKASVEGEVLPKTASA